MSEPSCVLKGVGEVADIRFQSLDLVDLMEGCLDCWGLMVLVRVAVVVIFSILKRG